MGGSNLTENLWANLCRESGDHGPFKRVAERNKALPSLPSTINRQSFISHPFPPAPLPEQLVGSHCVGPILPLYGCETVRCPLTPQPQQLRYTNDLRGFNSSAKLFDVFSGNLMIANYGSQGAIDNDDSSGYYRALGNVFAYGQMGMKSNVPQSEPAHHSGSVVNVQPHSGSVE